MISGRRGIHRGHSWSLSSAPPAEAASDDTPADIPEAVSPSLQSAAEAVEHAARSSNAEQTPSGVEHAMDQPELLKLSESIRVDGVSVSEMFTAGRLERLAPSVASPPLAGE